MSENGGGLFLAEGFLGTEAEQMIGAIRQASAEMFGLADETNKLLMRVVVAAADAAHTNLQSPESIAVRLGLRAAESFQGVVLLAERGIVASARTLARSILEDAFALSGLLNDPQKFVATYQSDHQSALRRQMRFITEKRLGDPRLQAALAKKLNSIQKGPRLEPYELATDGPLMKLYLSYLRLSNDSAHPSATALEHHVERAVDGTGWRYRWGATGEGSTDSTLHSAIEAALPVAVALVQYFNLAEFNNDFEGMFEHVAACTYVV